MAELVGRRQLLNSLRRLPKKYKKELPKIHKAAATPVAKEAKSIVPRRSGDLAGSIRALGSQKSGRAAAGSKAVPYAGVIHFGWPDRNIKPNPFLQKALEKKEREVIAIFVQEQDRLIDRVWGRG